MLTATGLYYDARGNIIVDVEWEEKKKLTVEELMNLFTKASGKEFANDRTMLS